MPRRGVVVPAVAALLLAATQVVWTAVFLNGSGDGPALAMALVGLIAAPACIATAVVRLIPRAAPRTVVLTTCFVAATGIAVGAFVAAIFVSDQPGDPAWIGWVADTGPFAGLAAVLLAATLAWTLLPIRSPIARFFAAVPIAAVGFAVTALVLLQTTVVWLLAVALLVVLLVLAIRARRVHAA